MAKKIMVFCFWAMLVVPTLVYPLCKNFLPDGNTENRELAKWPEGIPNPAAIETYINDHAPFRSQYLSLYAGMNLTLFDSIDSKDVINGKDGWLFYTGNESLQAYRGMELFPEEFMQLVLEYLTDVRDKYTKDNKDFVFIIAPNKELVYEQYMPEYYFKLSDTSKARQLVEYIRANSDIQVLYPLEMLKEASRNQWVYYMTDTHWNDVGGFLTAQEIIGALGGEDTGLDQAKVEFSSRELGDLANMFHMPDSMGVDHHATVSGYLEEGELNFLEDDNAGSGVVHITNVNAPESRKLTVIRDSFAQAMMEPLARYYGELVFINWERLSPDMPQLTDTDLFVYEVVERNLGRIIDDLDNLLK